MFIVIGFTSLIICMATDANYFFVIDLAKTVYFVFSKFHKFCILHDLLRCVWYVTSTDSYFPPNNLSPNCWIYSSRSAVGIT